MANTYCQIYVQCVFAVKYRQALLDRRWRSKVFSVIGNLVNETGCKTLVVNGVEDHVHCLISLRPSVAISDLMKSVKARSSKFINDKQLSRVRFEWQRGYGVFSYSSSEIDRVYKYIQNQESHHRKEAFLDEYVRLLDDFKVPYDPEYVFQTMI
jgi:putative transposase